MEQQANSRVQGRIKPWSRLRLRMAISYVAVTLLIVLLLESLAVTIIYFVFTRSPAVGYFTLQSAGNAAQILALQAAVNAEGAALNPATTFEPGHPTTLSLEGQSDSPDLSWFRLTVPYVPPGAMAPNRPAVALLIGPDERVLASTYPDRYPASLPAAEVVPAEIDLIRGALAGNPDGAVRQTSAGMLSSVTQTIQGRDQQPLGAIFVQAPAGGPPNASLLTEVASVVIPTGVLWLCLMLPIGLVFGVLTTRGLIKRIERLAGATARFKQGDLAQRVPVRRLDEIGMLEQQFNEMAEQLVESFEQRQTIAEQSARREERARIEQEMSSAHYIQKSLLPDELPAIPGWHIESRYHPAREVGGDLYDFLPLPDGRLGIAIGDANGKGVPSALIMATACAMLRTAAPGAASPGSVLALVNNLLHVYIPRGTFATCFYASLDPRSGRLCYANAGHNLPYLLHDHQIVELQARGMPLGLMPEQDYVEGDVNVAPADCLLLYTDGLVEAHDPQRQMFGTPRLKRLILEHSAPDGLIDYLLTHLHAFAGPAWAQDQEDDVTLVLLRKLH